MRSSEQIALTIVKTIAARPNATKIIAAIVALLLKNGASIAQRASARVRFKLRD